MSNEERVPCPCNGDNPNCFRCFGWGYINKKNQTQTQSDQNLVSESPSRKNSKYVLCQFCRNPVLLSTIDSHICSIRVFLNPLTPKSSKKEDRVKCQVCSQHILKSKLSAHIKKCKSGPSKVPAKNETKVNVEKPQTDNFKPKSTVVCPICNAKLFFKNRFAHASKVHPKNEPGSIKFTLLPKVHSNEKMPPIKSEKVISNELKTTSCPKCSKVFLMKDFPDHLLKAHKLSLSPLQKAKGTQLLDFQGGKRRNPSKSKSTVHSTSRPPVPTGKSANSKSNESESHLDAKRHYGTTFRENGKFGSYPVHDDYGDES